MMFAMNGDRVGEDPNHPVPTLLDIGTGTGLLSLMAAQKNKVQVDAIEIDPSAAEQAAENGAASPWSGQVNVLHQDLRTWQHAKRYNVILSNPPFYQNELKSFEHKKNLAHHDAGLTLPLLFFFIKNHLAHDGFFYLLLPAKRKIEIEQRLVESGLFLQEEVLVQQTPKHPAFRWMIQGGHKKAKDLKTSTLIIKNEENEYTPAFRHLLKDYYLHL